MGSMTPSNPFVHQDEVVALVSKFDCYKSANQFKGKNFSKQICIFIDMTTDTKIFHSKTSCFYSLHDFMI